MERPVRVTRRPRTRPRRRRAALAVALLACACGRSPSEAPSGWRPDTPARAIRLDADVRFTATQVVVDNRGESLWRDVRIDVFRPRSRTPYRFVADAVLGHRSLTVGALNFVAPDGSRLSPFAGAPTVFAITATLPDGSTGFLSGALREVAPP